MITTPFHVSPLLAAAVSAVPEPDGVPDGLTHEFCDLGEVLR